jgi:Domain of unknown function (DUF4416)
VAQPQPPEPVKYFIAILWADQGALSETYARLRESWGAIDFEGPDRLFDLTHYYDQEMGPDLQRRLISFAALRSPEELAQAKLTCNAVEDALADAKGRRVNLDLGYLDHNKIVLASAKGAGQKIYLRDGIYADLVARYAQGRYQPFPWTFLDFKDGRYDDELATLRGIYLQQIKQWRAPCTK